METDNTQNNLSIIYVVYVIYEYDHVMCNVISHHKTLKGAYKKLRALNLQKWQEWEESRRKHGKVFQGTLFSTPEKTCNIRDDKPFKVSFKVLRKELKP